MEAIPLTGFSKHFPQCCLYDLMFRNSIWFQTIGTLTFQYSSSLYALLCVFGCPFHCYYWTPVGPWQWFDFSFPFSYCSKAKTIFNIFFTLRSLLLFLLLLLLLFFFFDILYHQHYTSYCHECIRICMDVCICMFWV